MSFLNCQGSYDFFFFFFANVSNEWGFILYKSTKSFTCFLSELAPPKQIFMYWSRGRQQRILLLLWWLTGPGYISCTLPQKLDKLSSAALWLQRLCGGCRIAEPLLTALLVPIHNARVTLNVLCVFSSWVVNNKSMLSFTSGRQSSVNSCCYFYGQR